MGSSFKPCRGFFHSMIQEGSANMLDDVETVDDQLSIREKLFHQ
ncbi:hypothetical protein ELS84_2846 [Enterococcus faecalis]|nr:hypothetical protein ELS84_2846 [Enterococcus faecalis]OSH07030.1 hypothetical protein EFDM72_2780 [Enterococcus faecalis]